MTQKTANEFSSNRTPIKTIRFDVFDILELMAKENVLATNEKIIRASKAAGIGVLTKLSISKEKISQFSNKLENSICDILEDTFIDELSSKFTEEDFIILSFFDNYVELQISDVFAKTTDEIETLVKVIFVRKIDSTLMLDSLKVDCNNCTLISVLSKDLTTSMDMVKLVCNGFPFYFSKEDFEKKNIFINKFKKLKSLRSK